MKWLVFITLVVWFYLAIRYLMSRRLRVTERLTEFVVASPEAKSGKKIVSTSSPKRQTVQTFRALMKKLASRWLRTLSSVSTDRSQAKLDQAGRPGNMTIAEWIGVRLLMTGIGAALGAVSLGLVGGNLRGLAILLGCVLLGWIGPDFWLSRRATTRQAEMLRQLPSTLDLLTVSVEAGLGFDQAVARVSQKMKGPLSDELERALLEMRLGTQRSVALQRMAKRIGVDEIKSFVSAVVQADKLGIGLAQVLRVQSEEARRRRKMDAEERAMKAPIKMLFPLVLFVFPSLFIVILGPAVLHVLQVFRHGA